MSSIQTAISLLILFALGVYIVNGVINRIYSSQFIGQLKYKHYSRKVLKLQQKILSRWQKKEPIFSYEQRLSHIHAEIRAEMLINGNERLGCIEEKTFDRVLGEFVSKN